MKRTIQLKSVTDGYVYPKLDMGITRDGEDTQSRSSLKRALETKVDFNGARFPLFVLAEAPPAGAYAHDDPMLDLLRGEDGQWKTGTPEWHKACEVLCERRAAKAERSAAKLRSEQASSIAENLSALVGKKPAKAKEAQ